MSDALAALRAVLGTEPPASLRALPERDVAELTALIEKARAKQRADLRRIADETLAAVPFPIRGLVKKVLLQ